MSQQLRSVTKVVSVIFNLLMAIETPAFEYFSSEDQTTIQQWVHEEGFDIYPEKRLDVSQQNDPWQYTQLTLQALHTSQPDQFYHYLSKLIIAPIHADNDETSQLLHTALKLNKTQTRIVETYKQEQNENELARWLGHYIALKKRPTKDEKPYSNLFEVLTLHIVRAISACPEMSILGNYKGARAKRHAILQCIAKTVDLHVIDIDISHNQVITSEILGPKPLSTNLTLPSATVLENSKQHISTILTYFYNPELQPVILLTTPREKGFLIQKNRKTRKNTNKLSVKPLTNSEINKIIQYYNGKSQHENKRNKHVSSRKPGSRNWLEVWITSPGYSAVTCIGIGIVITLLAIYTPYPGNPWML